MNWQWGGRRAWGLLFVALLAAAPAWAAQISAPGLLSSDAVTSGTRAYHPSLATDGRGTWVAAWHAAGQGEAPQLNFARSTDNGQTWSAPARVRTDRDGFDGDPRIATDGKGHWVVVFRSFDDLGGAILTGVNTSNVLAVHSLDNGLTWSAAVPVNSNAATKSLGMWDGSASLATDRAGNWMVAWSRFDYSGSGSWVYSACSSDNGANWTPAVQVMSYGVGYIRDARPALSTDVHGTWYVAFQFVVAPFSPLYHIWTTVSPDLGAHWTDFNDVTPASGAQDVDCAIAADGGGGVVVAYESQGGIWRAWSGDHGVSWSAVAPITTAATSAHLPALATDGRGTWVALWNDLLPTSNTTANPRRLSYNVSGDGGATWSADAPLFGSADQNIEPGFIFDNEYLDVAADGATRWVFAWSSDTAGLGPPGVRNILIAGSDALGSPLATPPLTVLSPGNGDTRHADAPTTISWTADLATAGSAVAMELWNSQGWVADLGVDWSPSGHDDVQVHLPPLPGGSDYRIRVVSTYNPLLSAMSAGTFSIVGTTPPTAVRVGGWAVYR